LSEFDQIMNSLHCIMNSLHYQNLLKLSELGRICRANW